MAKVALGNPVKEALTKADVDRYDRMVREGKTKAFYPASCLNRLEQGMSYEPQLPNPSYLSAGNFQ